VGWPRVQTTVVGKTVVGHPVSLEDVLTSPETASPPLNSFAAASCNASATGGPQFNNTYQSNNDNTGGAGVL
jgi:hypothetical protein